MVPYKSAMSNFMTPVCARRGVRLSPTNNPYNVIDLTGYLKCKLLPLINVKLMSFETFRPFLN